MQESELTFAWAKTLLSAYKYLETITEAIDNLVLKQGVSSYYYNNGYHDSTLSLANKMLALTERKQKLIKLKLMIEDGLSKLSDADARLLVLTYFDLLKSTIVSEQLGVSLRTFFRKKTGAIQKFGNALKFLGYDVKTLQELLKDEGWILNLFEQLNSVEQKNTETDKEEQIKQYKLLKYIMQDLKTTGKKKYGLV